MAWLFALLRCLFPRDPVKQAVEGARHAVSLVVRQVANAEALEVLKNDPAARAYIEAIINDYEAVVRLAIGMRACQIAGIRFNSAARAFHIPARANSLQYLFRRIQALVYLSQDIEHHAQTLAIRLQRERDADPLAAHGSTDTALRAAAHHEALGVGARHLKQQVGLMVSSNLSLGDRLRPSNHEAVLTALAQSRGPPHSIVAPHPQPALQGLTCEGADACASPFPSAPTRPIRARCARVWRNW